MVPAIGLAAIGAMDLLSSVTSGGASLPKTSTLKTSKTSFNILDAKAAASTTTASQTNAPKGALSPPTLNTLLSAQDAKSSGQSDAPGQSATSTSTTNSDGSITTTLTYADGTKVTMNQPATATALGSASAKYNLVEQLVQRQANALSTAAKSSVSVSA